MKRKLFLSFGVAALTAVGVALAGGFSKRVIQSFGNPLGATLTWTNTIANFSVDRISVVFPSAVANTSTIYQVSKLVNDSGAAISTTSLVAEVGSGSATTFTWDNDTSLVILKGDLLIVVNSDTNQAYFVSDMLLLD
jgi:hypothetical protein